MTSLPVASAKLLPIWTARAPRMYAGPFKSKLTCNYIRIGGGSSVSWTAAIWHVLTEQHRTQFQLE